MTTTRNTTIRNERNTRKESLIEININKKQLRKLMIRAYKITMLIFDILTCIAVGLFLISICGLDSESHIPVITLLLSLAWIGFSAWVHGLWMKG